MTNSAPKLAPGQPAPPFALPDVNPATRDLARDALTSLDAILRGKRGAVVLWMCNHCPYVVGSHERITALARDTMSRGLAWVAICSNDAATHPEDGAPKMAEYAAKWSLPFPYLHDESQRVARAYGVERTPEIFLLDADARCAYEGALDDNPKNANAVTDRPLKDAIDDLLVGRPVQRPQTAAIGCSIKWKQ